MKRTTTPVFRKADLILTADWHLKDKPPICRVGDFEEDQWKKVDFVSELQVQHECKVVHAGDLFDHWKPSPYLLSRTMDHLPEQFFTIYGNHDLPQHNIEDAHRCGVYALEKAGKLAMLPGTHWGQIPEHPTAKLSEHNRKILVWHVMTYQGKKPWPGCTDPISAALLRKYKDYDLILTGHNHKSFVEEYGGRLLVNPGSLMRQDADQLDFRPRVYLYFAEDNRVEPVFIPIRGDAVTRLHIERDAARSDRIEAFISKLDGDWSAGMSFENNLEAFFSTNQVRTSVKNIIYKSLEI